MHTPEIPTEGLRLFFERFEALSAASDVEGLARLYAPAIMVAGPAGTQVVTAADLMRAIPKRKQILESIGHQRTTLTGLEERPLDRRYVLARAEWRWQFAPDAAGPRELTLPSTFVVDRSGEEPRIVVYVMHQDLFGVLRERGWLPQTA